MTVEILNQQTINGPLGSSEGYPIKQYGCALCCLTALCNYYGRAISAIDLNTRLVAAGGFQSNGTTNPDGTENKTLLVWGMLAAVFGEMRLERNLQYPKTPAEMNIIDTYLSTGKPVIVGVSFLHNAQDEVPSHYVLLTGKNPDGTYQCMDPWFGDLVNFDARYAANGMSVAQCILQVVCYGGPVPTNPPPPTPAPIVAAPQQAQTDAQIIAQENYNLYLSQVELNKQKDARIQELEEQVIKLQNDKTQLQTETASTKELASTYAANLADVEKKDSAAITQLQSELAQTKEQADAAKSAAQLLQTKPTTFNLLKALDNKFSQISFLQKRVKELTPAQQAVVKMAETSIYSLLSIKGGDK